jgi:hypothetical protein
MIRFITAFCKIQHKEKFTNIFIIVLKINLLQVQNFDQNSLKN